MMRNIQAPQFEAEGLNGSPPPEIGVDGLLKAIGKQIQAFRKSRGLSQKQLAGKAGLDRAYLSSLEHGKHNVTVGAVFRISRALEIPFEKLVIPSSSD